MSPFPIQNSFRRQLDADRELPDLWIYACQGDCLKRPNKYLWERQERIARYRQEEKTRRRGKRRKSPADRHVAPGETIRAPERFAIFQDGGREVGKFIRAISQAVLIGGKSVKLDFRFTTAFHPDGTILLYSEINRVVSLSALAKPITIIDPRFRRPREVLKQIGIYEITGDSCDIVPEREDVVYWKATSGYDQSGDRIAMLASVAERVNKSHADQIEISGVWRGVSEAIANSVEHAYKYARDDGFSGLDNVKWWMFTQLRDGIFTVAVCDLGCGYRKTVGQTIPEWVFSKLAEAFRWLNSDALSIEAAMEYGRTGTKQSERGKGSRDAISVLESHGSGQLLILSNAGWVTCQLGQDEKMDNKKGNLQFDIRGTIVLWRLPLKESAHGQD